MLSAESIKVPMFLADFEGRISEFPTVTVHPETFCKIDLRAIDNEFCF